MNSKYSYEKVVDVEVVEKPVKRFSDTFTEKASAKFKHEDFKKDFDNLKESFKKYHDKPKPKITRLKDLFHD